MNTCTSFQFLISNYKFRSDVLIIFWRGTNESPKSKRIHQVNLKGSGSVYPRMLYWNNTSNKATDSLTKINTYYGNEFYVKFLPTGKLKDFLTDSIADCRHKKQHIKGAVNTPCE